MRVADLNWMQLAEYLTKDDRAVLPLGSTEEHGYLSLMTDAILAERVAVEAAEPLGVPVFPVVAYGMTPSLLAYPGSLSLRFATYAALLGDILDSLAGQGFRRFLLVNGHGGNSPAASFAQEWMTDHRNTTVRLHNWFSGPHVREAANAVDPVGLHGSWKESFPWNRAGPAPSERKPPVDVDRLLVLPPDQVKEALGDGNFGGYYQKPDEEILKVWQAGVAETRALIESL